jgi:squalene-associated FAD-dependent desaturase
MTPSGKSVIVIGGGVSGLSAATLLAKKGYRVTLIEQRNRLGGRTFSIEDPATSETIDNGQHVLMGCYVYTLRWLDMLGQLHHLDAGRRIRISFAEPQKKLHPLIIPNLPMPFHLIAGMLQFKNLSVWERLSLLKAGLSLPFRGIGKAFSVDEWLTSVGQSEKTKKYFWNPVCLAVMNSTAVNASAKLFTDALKQMFLVKRDYSRIMIPKIGLSELFAKPAEEVILQNGGRIMLSSTLKCINVEQNWVNGVKVKDRGTLHADHYLSAVPPGTFKKMLEAETVDKYFKDKLSYKTSPIVSVYLWLKGVLVERLFDGPFIGCIHTRIQWIFKKSDHLIEVTISDGAEIVDWEREKIFDTVLGEMKNLFPVFDRESVRHYQIIKERFATFNPAPGSEKLRPTAVTPIGNLFLAGDWADTGLPSTIESAVKSGFAAADCIPP